MSETSRRCSGIAGLVFGHHFEPRFSVVERERQTGSVTAQRASGEEMRAYMTLVDRVYHGDVCSRCGIIVNLRAPTSANTGDDVNDEIRQERDAARRLYP